MVITLTLFVVAAPRVFADSATEAWMYDMDADCSDSFDVSSSSISSACDGSGSSTGSGGGISGDYYFCSAKGSSGGTCVDKVTLENGTVACAKVRYSASCQCKSLVTSGSCTFTP
jgi:hypothetical protein